jgi:hypothetical protein
VRTTGLQSDCSAVDGKSRTDREHRLNCTGRSNAGSHVNIDPRRRSSSSTGTAINPSPLYTPQILPPVHAWSEPGVTSTVHRWLGVDELMGRRRWSVQCRASRHPRDGIGHRRHERTAERMSPPAPCTGQRDGMIAVACE